jgi:hypothetical protein
MISGLKTRIDRWLGAALPALALALTATPARALDLPELMALLAQKKSGEATFIEQRFVRGLDAPIDLKGTLSFSAPDRLVRATTAPRAETMSVEGNTLTLTRGGRTRTMALDSMPELLGMIEAMRGTLGGDAKVLQRYFSATVGGASGNWTLELQPVDERLAAQLRQMRMTGRASEVLSVEMEFIGGDRSLMFITPRAASARSAP